METLFYVKEQKGVFLWKAAKEQDPDPSGITGCG
jgi:hypothetical protein